ncbi:glycoside hydrolase family 3 protein, partial [bacterium]
MNSVNSSYLRKLLLSLAISQASVASAQTLPYQDPKAPLETRVSDLMARLTPDEKIALLGGTGFTTQPIPRLGIPPMTMADAGQGVRGGPDSTLGPATAFPAGVTMASTWNPVLVGKIGAAIGVEAQNKGTGVQVMLGPAVNIHRSPQGGRNGEYFSEDPFLAARLSVGYIQGMQGTGTVACIKHFSANNQETDRFAINETISERALREIYWPAFEAGVKEGGVWTVMSSYNRLNGPHTSASKYLLTDVLKRGWGFDGMVMSDWGGVHAVARTIEAGNDLEMPNGEFLSAPNVKDALDRGLITWDMINQNVSRTMRTVLRSGIVDRKITPNPALVNSQANRDVALA